MKPWRLDRTRGGAWPLIAGVTAAALSAVEAYGQTPCQPDPVAIVASLSGAARVKSPSEPQRALELFDRLCVGAALEIGPQSSVTVAFANGHRFELEGGAHVTVSREGFTKARGRVRILTPVPPLPRIPPVRDLEGGHTAALRVRAEGVGGLYPRHGATVIADEAVLRFSPPVKASECTVEVQDATGNLVFKTDTGSSEVALPPGDLAPGKRYTWRVGCPATTGTTLRAEASLVSLSAAQTEARTALKAAALEDTASLALLAEIDQSLGLLREAREEFRAACARDPGNMALRLRLARLDRWMDDLPR